MAWRTIVASAAVAIVLAGCASNGQGSNGTEGSGGPVATSSSTPCGPIPASSGPASAVAALRVSAPVSAATGTDVPVQVSVVVRAEGGRILTDASRSELLVTKDGAVVGRTASTGSALLVPVQLSAGAVRPAQVVPASVHLRGCSSGDSGPGSALPPGQYGIVAVLGYGQDPLNAAPEGSAGAFALVSDPSPVTVR
jgi:hypothetical protein